MSNQTNDNNNNTNNVNTNAKKPLSKEDRAALRKLYTMALEEAPISEVIVEVGKNMLPNNKEKAIADGVMVAGGIVSVMIDPEEWVIATSATVVGAGVAIANQVLSDGGLAASELVKRPFRTIKGWFSKKED